MIVVLPDFVRVAVRARQVSIETLVNGVTTATPTLDKRNERAIDAAQYLV